LFIVVVADERLNILEILRSRVLRGLRGGTLEAGARLPSARELVAEFGVDHRLILGAYRELAAEGLVEVRERGGVYVSRTPVSAGAAAALPIKWFADVFADGVARDICAPDLATWLTRSIGTLRLHAIVISSTEDQAAGLARELHDDFGLDAEGFTAAQLQDSDTHVAALKRADLFVATRAHVALAETLASRYDRTALTIEVRPDLVVGEWAMLLKQPVWAIVATAEFGEMLRRFFADVEGFENLNVVVFGRDDLEQIPIGAPTYVTHRARKALGDTKLRGRVLPPARTIALDSARAIFDVIVQANIRALQAAWPRRRTD
jgi:hypothetical protein